jgi:hypothetical protein
MPDQQKSGPNYLKEAFQWQYNVIALVGAAAASAVSLSPVPLILAAGLELMYLATVPTMPRFQRLMRSRRLAIEKAEHDERVKQILNTLPSERREHYRQLEQLCKMIRANLARLSSTSQIFVSQLDSRLDELLAAFVRLANHDMQHVQYLGSTNPNAILRESQELEARLPKETPRVREVNQKRIEILRKRVEKYGKISENRQVIDAQCNAIEDVLQLIREQSMTMEDPQQLSERLETLVRDVESTEEAVREVEAIFQMSPEIEGSSEASSTANRNRIGN